MCRIFGISYGENEESLTAAEIAAKLYPALIHQGPHAWGWMTYSPDYDEDGFALPTPIRYFKTPGRCDTPEAKKTQLADIPEHPEWLVCHLRFATHGKPEININNHPIPHGNIIGIHNGVLRNHQKILDVTGRQDDSALVDSEAIFAAVNKWGPMKGLRKIQGDMVTVFADSRDPSAIHIARSHGRQVTIGWTKNGNIIFASEEKALHCLEPHIEFVKFSTVSENRLLTLFGGEIIERVTFAPVHQKYVPPPPTVRTMTTLEEWERNHIQNRASKRGELLFPKKGKTKKPKHRNVPVEEEINEIVDITDGPLPDPEDGKLYYFDGELYTRSEYQLLFES